MRSNEKKNIMPDAIGHIDDDIVSGVLEKLERGNARTKNRPARRLGWLGAFVAIAACAVIFALSMPGMTSVVNNIDIFRPVGPVGADGSSGLVENPPEYDGSRGLLYEISEDGESASFIGYGSCTDETVYIASTYEGLPVTVMYMGNSRSAPYNQSNIKNIRHIVISDTVKYVDSKCIYMCPNIESVCYGASVENIGSFTFSAGYGLKFSKVEVFPDNPYYSDKGNCIVDLRTKALVLGTSDTVIPDDGSVEIIGIRAFAPAQNALSSIVIPEGVKIIDSFAFSGCAKLESVLLPDSLEVIETGAFRACTKLKKLELGTNLKAVGQVLFFINNTTEIYYKGTVGQWNAVIKTCSDIRYIASVIGGDVPKEADRRPVTQYTVEPFTVYCTDGDSDSTAGETGNYKWRSFPEYKKYDIGGIAIYGRYFIGPSGSVTKIISRETDGSNTVPAQESR